jgi:hypothetical protein
MRDPRVLRPFVHALRSDSIAMHPYREPPPPAVEERGPDEEAVLYATLLAIGSIPVIVAGVGATAFGFDATLGSLMTAAGALGLLRRRRYVHRRS